jgi:hypothetical protein
MSCSFDGFLQQIVPDVLRLAHERFKFAVVGTRAINLYLSQAAIPPAETMDWDVIVPVDRFAQLQSFSNFIISALKKKGYKIHSFNNKGTGDDDDLFSFRSRDWIRLTADVCETQIVMLDIYQVPSFTRTMSFMDHEGLLYSDMGFLLRELNRSERDAKNVLGKALKAGESDIGESLKRTETELEDVNDLLDETRANIDELIESYGQVDDKIVNEAIKDEIEKCGKVKKTLMRVLNERELLFAAAASGKFDKSMIEPICRVCREYEKQYNQYTELRAECSSISRSCR